MYSVLIYCTITASQASMFPIFFVSSFLLVTISILHKIAFLVHPKQLSFPFFPAPCMLSSARSLRYHRHYYQSSMVKLKRSITSSHQRLDHVHPLWAEQVDALEDIDLALGRCLLREDVDGDESSCPTDAGTEEIHKQT